MSTRRKIIKFLKKITPRKVKDSIKSSWKKSAHSPYQIMSIGNEYVVQIKQDIKLFGTEAACFDIYHIFEDDFHEVSSFISFAENKLCFLDVGASKGVYSTIFTKLNPHGIANAFEGSTQSCTAIHELAEKNLIYEQINVRECMVGNYNGKGLFSQESCGYVQIFENESVKKIEREVITLDSFCNENNLFPDLIKIDVEGYEFEVIKGAQAVLEQFSPVILLELHLSYLDRRGIFPDKILTWLSDRGYQILDIQKKPISFSNINSSMRPTIHLIANP